MLLESIADGGRPPDALSFTPVTMCGFTRFILRIVRDSTMAEDLVSQVFPGRVAHRPSVRRPFPGPPPGCCRSRRLQGADGRCVNASTRTSTRRTCLKSPTKPTLPEAPLARPAAIPAPFCAPLRRETVAGASRDHQPSSTTMRSPVERGRRDHRHPSPEHGEDPDVLCP